MLGYLLEFFWTIVFHILESGEIVKNGTALKRELNFQGLVGLVFACFFVVFLGGGSGWFWEHFNNHNRQKM